MSLPGDALSSVGVIANFLAPDTLGRSDGLEDYERAGIGLNDPSQGLLVKNWRVRALNSSNEIRVAAEPYTTETSLISASNITEVSLAFDQNMRPAIAYIENGQAKLYWYDSVAEAQVTTTLAADITSVFLTMDDKRAPSTALNLNDVLLFYVRGAALYYRQQRDRFNTERFLTTLLDSAARLRKVGMSTGYRVQMQVIY
jgi:hypothetical protein